MNLLTTSTSSLLALSLFFCLTVNQVEAGYSDLTSAQKDDLEANRSPIGALPTATEAADPTTNCRNWSPDDLCDIVSGSVGTNDCAGGAIKAACRKSCGQCNACSDAQWCASGDPNPRATQDICDVTNTKQYVKFCPQLCGACGPDGSSHAPLGDMPDATEAASSTTNCQNWESDAYCSTRTSFCTGTDKNSKRVQQKCRKACAMCDAGNSINPCVDDAGCASWHITRGKCETLKSKNMLRLCPASCGWCDGMTPSYTT